MGDVTGSGSGSTGRAMPRRGRLGAVLVLIPLAGWAAAPAEPPSLPVPSLPAMSCTAQQTGGFHDYPEDGEHYEPALFHPQRFRLEPNVVFMMNLAGDERSADLYLTMTLERPGAGGATIADTTELECRQVRGANDAYGFSCVNLPPSEMILINARTLRFTRTAVGGWTFAGATDGHEGDSIFVEYGACEALDGA